MDGVDRPVNVDGPLIWFPAGRADCAIGLGVVFPFTDSLGLGKLGVMNGFGAFPGLSEIGGDGGVGASDGPDEVALFGGVLIVGDDADVVGDRSDLGDCGTAMGSRAGRECLLARLSSAC